jgi:DNA-binding XRE family transcriptional regulator
MTGYFIEVRPMAGGFRVVNAGGNGYGNVVVRYESRREGNQHLRRKLAFGLYATRAEAELVVAWLTGEGQLPNHLEPLPEHDDDHSPAPFPVRLRELRATAGLTVQELAESAGLTRQAVHNYESGARHPTWDAVQKLAAALGVSTDVFRD